LFIRPRKQFAACRAAEQLNGLSEGLSSTAEAAAASQYPALDTSHDGKDTEPSDELLFAKALLDAGEYQVSDCKINRCTLF
jgi:hypothetical protein